MTADDSALIGLVPSWELSMRARKLSPKTRDLYMLGVRSFAAWCDANGYTPALRKVLVLGYLADALDAGHPQPSSLASYLKGVKSFAKWCEAEGEIKSNEIAGIPEPKADDVILPSITPEQQAALLATCDPKNFAGKRDDAILRMLRDTGARAREMTGIGLEEVSQRDRTVLLHGKGGRDRIVAYSDATAVSLDRYLRARRRSKYAPGSTRLWLSVSGPELSYFGLWRMLQRRAEVAGVGEVNPHMWRRMWAGECLDADLSAGDLKSLAGWKSMTMVEHYTKQHSNRRAVEHQRRLFEARGEG